LDQVLVIEQIKFFKNEGLIVRFLNRNFVMIGDGLANAGELKELVIARSNVQPTVSKGLDQSIDG